jgi:hypothetical protein
MAMAAAATTVAAAAAAVATKSDACRRHSSDNTHVSSYSHGVEDADEELDDTIA